MTIRQASRSDLADAAALAAELWPSHTAAELEAELAEAPEEACTCFLALEDAAPMGFAQCSLRRDYVEGTLSSPVGYLEGIYVRPAYRGKGVARSLLAACEDWARNMGCREFASDCELENTVSLAFHQKAGFVEANRIVCFVKKLPVPLLAGDGDITAINNIFWRGQQATAALQPLRNEEYTP